MMTARMGLKWFIAGIIFSALWPSASTATKLALTRAQPLVIANVRFGIAALIMLLVAHLIKKERLPQKAEWKKLALYGLLNITIYLGLYVVAMQYVSAGVGSLAVATNPVFISLFSVFFLGKKLNASIIISLLVCLAGVLIAAWPLIAHQQVTPLGLGLLLLSMVCYSVGTIYFSGQSWGGLSLLAINGWQTLLGGLFLLPVTFITYQPGHNHSGHLFWLCVLWLAIPVSIFAVQLWLWLLRQDTVRAGLWLFLCPVFGFAFAAWQMGDRIDIYAITGIIIVIIGLIISKINSRD